MTLITIIMNFKISNHMEEYKNYKYKCEDKSLLSKYWNNFFTFIQKFIPTCIHPNILTVSSIFVIMLTYYLDNLLKNSFIFSKKVFKFQIF